MVSRERHGWLTGSIRIKIYILWNTLSRSKDKGGKLMKKIGLLIAVQFVVLTACSNAQGNSTPSFSDLSTRSPMNQRVSSVAEEHITKNIQNSSSIISSVTPTSKTDEEIIQERMKKLERKGELDLNNIKIVGVKGSLLKTILTYLEAIKEKDDKKRLSTIYAPDIFSDGLNRQEPYIMAIKELTLDNHRVKAVTEWYDLNKIADEVVIVNIEIENLLGLSNADFIYIRVNGKWKLYETQ